MDETTAERKSGTEARVFDERVVARADSLEDARALAEMMPRPISVRQVDDGWVVLRLLPTCWSPEPTIE